MFTGYRSQRLQQDLQQHYSFGVKTMLPVRDVGGLIPGSIKLDTVLPTTRHRCDVSSELCCPVTKPCCPDMGPAAC